MNKGNICAGKGQHGEGWDRVCRRVVLTCTCLIVLRPAPGKADRGCSIAVGGHKRCLSSGLSLNHKGCSLPCGHLIQYMRNQTRHWEGLGWDGDIAGRCSKGALRTGNKYTLFPTPEVTRLESTHQAAHSQKEVFFHPEPR